jgi:hypothetical protein
MSGNDCYLGRIRPGPFRQAIVRQSDEHVRRRRAGGALFHAARQQGWPLISHPDEITQLILVADTPGFNVVPHTAALGGFAIGAVVSGRIGKYYLTRGRRTWLSVAACFEGALLSLVAILVVDYGEIHQPSGTQLKGLNLSATVLTMTLTGLLADSHLAGGTNQNWHRRVLSVAAIFSGALAGALIVKATGLATPLAIVGLLVVLGAVLADNSG